MKKEEHCGFVYKTTNTLNGKIYIGQKTYKRQRKNNPVPSYLGSGSKIKQAIIKYGKENFKKEVICWCYSRQGMDDCERFFIRFLKTQNPDIGYNIVSGGQIHMPNELKGLYGADNPNYGNKWTEEQRRLFSEKKKKMKKEIGAKNPNAQPILCIDTGEKYDCIKDLCNSLGIRYSLLYRRMKKNKPINGKMYEKIKIK